jgi:hypothetical protein
VRCPDGTAIQAYKLRWKGSIHPRAYVFADGGKAAPNLIQLNIAAVKPWYDALLPERMRVSVTARCALLPNLD